MEPKTESTGRIEPMVITFDDFHWHELMDRCNVICELIETAIIDHPAADLQMKAWAEDAQRQLYNVANMAATEQAKFPKLIKCDKKCGTWSQSCENLNKDRYCRFKL
jgi:hypothetical protein